MLAGFGVRENAARGRHDGDAQAVAHDRQFFRTRIDAAARLRDARHVADRRLAFEIFQLDADALVLALGTQRFFAVAADIAFALENIENADAQRRGGRQDAVLLRRLRSEEHTSELQSLMRISYAVFCLKKKKTKKKHVYIYIK